MENKYKFTSCDSFDVCGIAAEEVGSLCRLQEITYESKQWEVGRGEEHLN